MLCTLALTDNDRIFSYYNDNIRNRVFMKETFSFDNSDCVILHVQKGIIHSSFGIKTFWRIASLPYNPWLFDEVAFSCSKAELENFITM